MDGMQVGRVGSARSFQGRLGGWWCKGGRRRIGGEGGLRREKTAVTREAGGGGGRPKWWPLAQPRPPFHKTAPQMQCAPDTNLLQRPNSTHVPASKTKIPRHLHIEVTS